jgi:putative membrane protein
MFQHLLSALRGFLIGTAEVIPGVSGGTVALVIGVYDRIIRSAAATVQGSIWLIRFQPKSALVEFKKIDVALLVPLLIGMVLAIFSAAAVLEPLLSNYPELSRAVFSGMIAASIYVPFSMATRRWNLKDYLIAGVFALAAFALTSLPVMEASNPNGFAIVGAAAIAVCALVLPGVSGSFFLLALGMYAPTISAVNDLDFGYLGLFVLGAILGLASFASGLNWLLNNKRRMTLVAMTGLMLGSLRALWPWQDEAKNFTQITDLSAVLVAFGLGAALIVGVIMLERRIHQ